MLRVALITITSSLFHLFYPQDLEGLEPPSWKPYIHPCQEDSPTVILTWPLMIVALTLTSFSRCKKKDEQSSPYIHTPLMMTLHLVSFSICLESVSSISSFPTLLLFYPGLPPAVRSISGLKGRGDYRHLGMGSALRALRALAYLAFRDGGRGREK